MRSELELLFERHIKERDLPKYETEYKFHPVRKWRADFAFPDPHLRLLVEVEGQEFGGRHTRGKGFIQDAEKYAEAQILGWRVLRIPGTWVHNGTGVQYLERLIHTLQEQS